MQWFAPRLSAVPESAALLLVRLVTGLAFILHGWPKIQHPMSWMQAAGLASVPPWLQAVAAIVEVVGGILLVLGLLTRLAALAILLQMVGAFVLVHIPHRDPFVAIGRPSFELALIYLVVAALLLVTGPGRWSADAMLDPEHRSRERWKKGN